MPRTVSGPACASDLSTLRDIFGWWPSELDIARNPGNWVMAAQSFFAAARVLDQESQLARKQMHGQVGLELNPDIFARTQTDAAAFFCMAFGLELAVKAALVSQGCLEGLETNDPLPFSHDLPTLARRIDGLQLSTQELECLEVSKATVGSGKYPVGLRPSEDSNGVPITLSYGGFSLVAEPLYGRLLTIAGDDRAP
jgi:hypothetical protein